MKVVIQRVSSASVTIAGAIRSAIGEGLLVLLGVGHEDSEEDIQWLVRKISGLRIFNDSVLAFNREYVASKGYEKHLTDKYPDKKVGHVKTHKVEGH